MELCCRATAAAHAWCSVISSEGRGFSSTLSFPAISDADNGNTFCCTFSSFGDDSFGDEFLHRRRTLQSTLHTFGEMCVVNGGKYTQIYEFYHFPTGGEYQDRPKSI